MQERYLMMLAQRVGKMEEMLVDLHKFLVTKAMRGTMPAVPSSTVIDESFLIKVVEALQRDPRVLVEHAWVIVHPPYYLPQVHSITVFLKLKKDVIASQVSADMSGHVGEALGISTWTSACLASVDEMCKDGGTGRPQVYQKTFLF